MRTTKLKPGYVLASVLLLMGVCVQLYLPGLSGPLLLDDYPQLLPLAQDANLADGSWRLYLTSTSGPSGRPLAMSSFIANAVLSGPDFYHWKLTNLILHLLVALLVYLLVERITSQFHDFSAKQPQLVAIAVAGLWLLHPVQVSTVLYTVQRMSLLAALFMVAGLLAYVEARRRQIAGYSGAWVFMLLCFAVCLPFAVVSKENGLLLPLLTFVLEIFIFRFAGAITTGRTLRVAYGACAVLASGAALASLYSNGVVVAGYEFRDFSMLERLLTQSRVLVIYLTQTFWPAPSHLSFFYDDLLVSRNLLEPPSTLLSLVFVVLVLSAAIALRDRFPLAGFGVAFFFAAHALESGPLPLELVFEHRNYLPSFGLCLAVVVLLVRLVSLPTLIMTVALALIALSLQTAKRAQIWSSEATLYSSFVEARPGSARAAGLLAEYLRVNGAHEAALAALGTHKGLAIELHRAVIECNLHGTLAQDTLPRLAQNVEMVARSQHFNAGVELANARLSGACEFRSQDYLEFVDRLFDAPYVDKAARHTLLVYKAQLMHMDGKRRLAIDVLDQAHRAWPDDPFPFMLAAEWLIDEGDMSGAISYLARAEDYSEIHKLRYQALLEWLRANVNPADDKVR